MKKPVVAAIAGTVALLSLGVGGVASAMDKAITLSVDGEQQQVHVWGSTVQDALDAHKIQLGERDVVSPSTSAQIDDGSTVEVKLSRPVTVTMDGKTSTIWTTATTLEAALAEIGLHDPQARLSVDRSTPLGRTGLTFTAVTPKDVQIKLGDTETSVRSTAADVASLLNDNGIAIDSDDRISPSLGTAITEGLSVSVQRVEVKEESKEQVIDFQTITAEDSSMAKGTQKVTTEGKEGTKTVAWQVVYVEGVEESRSVAHEEVTTAAVDKQVTVETKATASSTSGGSHTDWMAAAGISPADYSAVEILIQRESSWNPSAVNASSGACGLVQSLPCSKLGPNWSDPVTALIWGNEYVQQRYGGWQGALAHSYATGWY